MRRRQSFSSSLTTRAARGLWCARAVTQHPLGPPAVRAAAGNSESPPFTTRETTSAGPESRLYFHEMWLPGNRTLGLFSIFEIFNRKQDQNTKQEEHCWQCLVDYSSHSSDELISTFPCGFQQDTLPLVPGEQCVSGRPGVRPGRRLHL